MMVQGAGIVDIEDLDQDMFLLWQQYDLMGKRYLEVVTDAPPNVILFYTLQMDAIRKKPIKFKLREDNDNVND